MKGGHVAARHPDEELPHELLDPNALGIGPEIHD
jgi:hypothetical protein